MCVLQTEQEQQPLRTLINHTTHSTYRPRYAALRLVCVVLPLAGCLTLRDTTTLVIMGPKNPTPHHPTPKTLALTLSWSSQSQQSVKACSPGKGLDFNSASPGFSLAVWSALGLSFSRNLD